MYESSLDLPSAIPEPKGYKICVAVPRVKNKTAGGILLPDDPLTKEKTASIVGYVVKMGQDAYKDPDKFPGGPWCKEGEWIMFHSYSGTRFKIKDQEFRLINDDTVEAVVEDPSIVERA